MSTLRIKAAPTFLFFRQLTFDKVSDNDKITTGGCKLKKIEPEKKVRNRQ
jgi:hypothetical protein